MLIPRSSAIRFALTGRTPARRWREEPLLRLVVDLQMVEVLERLLRSDHREVGAEHDLAAAALLRMYATSSGG
jgi:hypothetical protein